MFRRKNENKQKRKEDLIRGRVQSVIKDELLNDDYEELTEIKEGQSHLSFKVSVTEEEKNDFLQKAKTAISPENQDEQSEYTILSKLFRAPEESNIGDTDPSLGIKKVDIREEVISQLNELFAIESNNKPFSDVELSGFTDNNELALTTEDIRGARRRVGEESIDDANIAQQQSAIIGLTVDQTVDALTSSLVVDSIDRAISIVEASEASYDNSLLEKLFGRGANIRENVNDRINFAVGARKAVSDSLGENDELIPRDIQEMTDNASLIARSGGTINESLMDDLTELKEFVTSVRDNKQETAEQWRQNTEFASSLSNNRALGHLYDQFSHQLGLNNEVSEGQIR